MIDDKQDGQIDYDAIDDDSGYLTIAQREAIADAMGGHQMDVYPNGYGFGPGIPLDFPPMPAPARNRHPRHKQVTNT